MTFVFKTCSKCGARFFLDNLREFGECLICGSKPKPDDPSVIMPPQLDTPVSNKQINSEVDLLLQSARRAATHAEAIDYLTKLLDIDPDHWEARLLSGFEQAEEKLAYKTENSLRFEWTDEWFLANNLMGAADKTLDRLKAHGSAVELTHAKDLIVTRISRHLKARSRPDRRHKIATDDDVFMYWKKIEIYLNLIDFSVDLLDDKTIREKDNLLADKIDLLQMKDRKSVV